jgi:FHS family L-fucose permease-like MFS transporter
MHNALSWFERHTGYRRSDGAQRRAFVMVTTLFFFWAFVHNINGTLIPHLRKALLLTDTQSALIDVAIYVAYFLAALPAGMVIARRGYRFTILAGLSLFALGALLFVPAALTRTYGIFLVALFVFGFGAAFLETVANPYISGLGDAEHSTSRLNFAQSFNGVGAVLTPLIGSGLILSGVTYSDAQLAAFTPAALDGYLQSEARSVVLPYLVLAAAIVGMIILFVRRPIPEVESTRTTGDVGRLPWGQVAQHPQLVWAVVAQFFYVGAQVGVGSFFVRFTEHAAGLTDKRAGFLWGSLAMVGFMVGRFAGTAAMRAIAPARLLALFGLAATVALMLAINTTGMPAVALLMTVPFFMSIMFPTIFDLGIKGTGEVAKLGSSLIIMAIVGGAVIPVAMGRISDATHDIQQAYYVPVLCFVIVTVYGLYAARVGQRTTVAER